MAREEDHGHRNTAALHFFLQVEPAHAGHHQVDHRAGCAFVGFIGEEFFGAGEALNLELRLFQQQAEGIPHGGVVVDQVDQFCVFRAHLLWVP